MQTTLLYRTKINGAHHLPYYKGKCAVVHGHTYYVDLEIEGEVDPDTGMVMDFHDLEKVVGVVPDHIDFNDRLANPTAENIAAYLFDLYKAAVLLAAPGSTFAYLSAVTVWEDPGQGVRVCE